MAGERGRVIIIGAGHNGLVAAFYLAKAGFAPLVLERRDIVGGSAATEEIHPGFRCPTVLHAAGPLLPQVVKDLQLEKHGLQTIMPDVLIAALHPGGRVLRIYADPERTAKELAAFSSRDAGRYIEFQKTFAALGAAIAPLLSITPPDMDALKIDDYLNVAKFGLKFRGLDKKDAYRLLRFAPMAVADLAAEWFETGLLRAIIAARGIYGAFAGPWSAGTSVALLMQAAFGHPRVVRGGPGALTQAIAKAASQAGAEIRTGSKVVRIQVNEGKAGGVVLESGEQIAAIGVVANTDPRRTFLKLVGPAELEPGFLMKVRSYRSIGAAAKVNLALSGLPAFADGAAHFHIGPDIDYLERAFDAAKYGDFSAQPYMDITLPSLFDPSLAPKGSHVMSIHVQYAPYQLRKGDWSSRRDEFANAVLETLSIYAPNIRDLIVHCRVITPLDLEQTYGLTGGHIFHGEHALDQLFAFRPFLGWAQYRTPIQGLYLCGAGTHPGGGITGAPGANAGREIIKDLKSRR